LLLDHGADPNAQAERHTLYSLETPLYRALDHGRIDIVRLFLEHGASVEVKNGAGKTPLDVAEQKGHYEIVKLLSEHRAKR
jgi:ankyrin repeat protein